MQRRELHGLERRGRGFRFLVAVAALVSVDRLVRVDLAANTLQFVPTTINGSYGRPFAGDWKGDALTDLYLYQPGSGADFVVLM